MTRRNPKGPLAYDSDIEATTRRNRREIRQTINYTEEEREDKSNPTEGMDENNPPPQDVGENNAPRTMYDYAKPHLIGAESSIVRPAITANNFELKPNTIQMIQQFVQFDGLQDEDPNTHIANFLEFCDTFNINGVSDDAIRLRQIVVKLVTTRVNHYVGSNDRKIFTKIFPTSQNGQITE
ncbi:RING-H2 finger protein ATL63 [Gossypium australe]|uniref:RING-H2 finger protein ATL63 n=1 Tax=Gossypium australe TaxID=47621 RepID=A0A5B6X601_9ROSI|nr:RING-H2 finger protein ATL63 [Gossypium australe]